MSHSETAVALYESFAYSWTRDDELRLKEREESYRWAVYRVTRDLSLFFLSLIQTPPHNRWRIEPIVQVLHDQKENVL